MWCVSLIPSSTKHPIGLAHRLDVHETAARDSILWGCFESTATNLRRGLGQSEIIWHFNASLAPFYEIFCGCAILG